MAWLHTYFQIYYTSLLVYNKNLCINNMHHGKCHLCLRDKYLQLSHVLPKFIFKWYKHNSPSYLRSGLEPNMRIQDGEKEYLFCEECEQRFSKWEDRFAREVFPKLQDPENANPIVNYKEWAIKFATSVSFRVAVFSEKENRLAHFPDELKAETQKAKEQWRKVLLGEIEHPGKYEQHLMHLDVIESHIVPNQSRFMNRYFIGATHADMVCSDDTAFTYAKMFRVVIFGHITELRNKWHGTRISPQYGTFGGKSIVVPDYVIEYMSGKANELLHAGDKLSQRQHEVIEKNVLNNARRMVSTAMFKASISDKMLAKGQKNDT